MFGKRRKRSMYCIHCGTNCPENSTFCPKCGKALHSGEPDKTISLSSSSALTGEANTLLNPNGASSSSPLQSMLKSFGIGPTQIMEARQTIVGRLGGLVTDAVPLLRGIFDFVLDIIVVAMLSIYLLLDGSRVMRWLRENLPLPQQTRGLFFLHTL